MKIEEKNQLIDTISEQLTGSSTIYVTDISDLNAEQTHQLRKLCFNKNVKLTVVKNTLLKKAMEKSEKDFTELYDILKGPSSVMLSETGNAPAKLIKEIRKTLDKPILKGAFVEEMIFIGDDQLETLSQIKSKEELIGDVITLLQSPAKNVISALQSGGQTLTGVLQTLSEKED